MMPNTCGSVEASLALARRHDRPSCDAHNRQGSGGVEWILDPEQPGHRVGRPASDDDVTTDLGHDAPGTFGEPELADDVGGEALPDAAGVEGRSDGHPHR